MSNKQLIPALRFKGFTAPWEQCELKKLGIITTGYPFNSNDFNKFGDYLVITNSNIQDDMKYVDNKIGNKIDLFSPNYKEYILNPLDILITMDGTVGRIAKVIENDMILAQRVGRLSPEINSEYLYYLLSNKRFSTTMINLSHGGTIKHISLNDIGNYLCIYTKNIDEQLKLGKYFYKLDNLITLHQRKLEKLKNLKKAMLEKMFPKNGSSIPDIRFSGFTDAWEQCEAIELFKSTSDKNYPELPVLSATQEFGMIKRADTGIDIYHDKKNEKTYKRVLPGEFVIHLRSFQGGFAHSDIEGITSPAYTVFGFKNKERNESHFWKYIFNSDTFIKSLEMVTYGIRDGRSISYNEFIAMKFHVPSYSEQRLISDFFRTLHKSITLHQRKLEKLKNIKKSLLEKMFV